MTVRPNYTNKQDACCRCGVILPTPKDHENPHEGDLEVWQPNPIDVSQWICSKCAEELIAEREGTL